MLDYLELENFRSVQKARVNFPASRLSAFVGANGSGKTNVVKAIEFISALMTHGLETAIKQGGFRDGILPKIIPISKCKEAKTVVKYQISLPDAAHEDGTSVTPTVEHELHIQWLGVSGYRVSFEKLTLREPLAIARAMKRLRKMRGNPESQIGEAITGSFVEFVRSGESLEAKFHPEVDSTNADDYAVWLGGPIRSFLGDGINANDVISKFIRSRIEGADHSERASIVDESYGSPVILSPQVAAFRQIGGSMRRFDLQLSELRAEQLAAGSVELGQSGANLPAAWRQLRRTSDSDAFRRVKRTLRRIAPHVLDTRIRSLRTGKEFVEFIESKSGRKVESWFSSDGTLRAMAILVAIESSEPHQLIIIEEPEQNLHPWASAAIVQHIRDALEHKEGLQMVITTHSAEVLDNIQPNELFVLDRSRKMGTRVLTLDQVAPSSAAELGDIGRLWSHGLLQGVPAGEELDADS